MALAASQHGVVARRQLLGAGLTPQQIGRRVRAGRLIVVHRGVYAVGHAALTVDGRWMAAVLACGAGAALSDRPAAAAWGLRPAWLGWREVCTTAECRRVEGVIVHRPRSLGASDVTRVRGVPVTTVARTLVDLADVVPPAVLRRVLEQAEVLRLDAPVTPIAGRRGVERLETALAELRIRVPRMTRSELERRMLDLCAARGLPPPDANFTVAGDEVDFTWPDHRVAVETDGWDTHGTRAAFGRDRRRSTTLQLAGWVILRFTYDDVVHDPGYVAASLATALARTAAV
jgi:hypothetical protein